ncbi:MAG: phage minor capsid protein, partial [Candidatus Fonsibacter sp.]
RFEETRNTPFLPGDSADYFCSAVRFNIQTGNTLPVFVPRIQTGQSDSNKTIYQVAIMYDLAEEAETSFDLVGFANVSYTPEDDTAALPAAPVVSQDVSSSYYYVYNYQHFVDLVNKTVSTAWLNLRAAYVATRGQALFD